MVGRRRSVDRGLTLFFGGGFEGVPVMATVCHVRLTMDGAERDLVFVARKQGQGEVVGVLHRR